MHDKKKLNEAKPRRHGPIDQRYSLYERDVQLCDYFILGIASFYRSTLGLLFSFLPTPLVSNSSKALVVFNGPIALWTEF